MGWKVGQEEQSCNSKLIHAVLIFVKFDWKLHINAILTSEFLKLPRDPKVINQD